MSILIKDLFTKKEYIPICLPWKEITQLTDLNQNNPDELLQNTEVSMSLQNSGTEVSNSEFLDQKNLKELLSPLNPPKWQRKQVALRNTDFLWT